MPSYSRRVEVPGKTAQELYDRISAEIDQFMEKITATIGEVDVERVPESREIAVAAKMFSATLNCFDGSIEVSGQLSLFAVPFRSKIDEGIDRWISKTFKI